MQNNTRHFGVAVLMMLAVSASCKPASCQVPEIQRVRRTRTVDSRPVKNAAIRPLTDETPVAKVLRWGDVMLKRADAIDDYSCTFVKRERISGRLRERQIAHARVRHQPFSVYVAFQSPSSMAGQAAVWVHGQNNGELLAKGTGLQSVLGTVSLDPNGYLAMKGNLHPITDMGIRNLVQKMITVTKHDSQYGQLKIAFRSGAKVGDRACTCIQFDHQVARKGLSYRMSRIYVDEKLALPIRFEGYGWPQTLGGDPVLIEEYTYANLKFNNGFTDSSFRL